MTEASPPQTKPRFAQTWASLWFDLVRGAAAVVVLLEHWRNLFFLDYRRLPALPSHAVSAFYLFTKCGHQAVIAFFILSGYFIGGTVLKSVARQQWSLRDYSLRRLVRLWLGLVPSLALCWLWDTIGIHSGRAPMLYGGTAIPNMIHNVIRTSQPGILIGNLFFLQTIHTSTFGSNGPLWSLAYEFWYYVLFPIGFFAISPKLSGVQRALCGLAFLAICAFVGKEITEYLPIWLSGVLLYRMPAPKLPSRHRRWLLAAATLVFVAVFVSLSRAAISVLLSDYLLAVFTFFFLWLLLSERVSFSPGPLSRFCRGIARFSYSLYALHMPLLLLISAWILGDNRWLPTAAHFACALLFLLIALVYAYTIASLTEFQTDRFRIWIEIRLGWPHPAPALASKPGEGETAS